jgi:hypothetical protein
MGYATIGKLSVQKDVDTITGKLLLQGQRKVVFSIIAREMSPVIVKFLKNKEPIAF